MTILSSKSSADCLRSTDTARFRTPTPLRLRRDWNDTATGLSASKQPPEVGYCPHRRTCSLHHWSSGNEFNNADCNPYAKPGGRGTHRPRFSPADLAREAPTAASSRPPITALMRYLRLVAILADAPRFSELTSLSVARHQAAQHLRPPIAGLATFAHSGHPGGFSRASGATKPSQPRPGIFEHGAAPKNRKPGRGIFTNGGPVLAGVAAYLRPPKNISQDGRRTP